ncbi:hypothetical protein CCACVL1_19139, partial [Corchorus capsularis]
MGLTSWFVQEYTRFSFLVLAVLIRVKIYEKKTIRELSEDIGVTSAEFLAE